jgi:predicted amidophosphoribosyltransferase
MADLADRAQQTSEVLLDAAIRAAARPIPAGEPGECSECGDALPRLVGGLCATCREPARAPRRW